ncbi:DUF3604 domain-containing protein [Haloferula sp.]|uniref:DUF3604 domain-containing protein n=1 Tax=Haloferula sp. TaxID=2497595 RepID=UPI00329D8DA4
MNTKLLTLFVAATAAGSATLKASPFELDATKGATDRIYSPYAGRGYPDQVLFGDTHFHTNLSFDAGLIGTTLDVDAAYRSARGEKVLSNTGQPFQLIRPLDFLIITDHAEMIGLAPMLREGHPALLADPWGKTAYERFSSGLEGQQQVFADIIRLATVEGTNPFSSDEAATSIWLDFLEKAEHYNEPGRFTAMTGFEWTSTPKGDNLHRVVLFGDGFDKTSRTTPFSMFDSEDPEDLWKYLANYEELTGGRTMAIPHNGNLSNGLMFNGLDFNGKPITADYATRRMRWEPLYEMSQIKGDEEAHPYLSPDDEFANFENWDVGNIAGTVPKEKSMLRYEYARSALQVGLELEGRIGVNPYKFGMMAATDTHTALASSREENYFGKYRATEPSPTRHNNEVIPAKSPDLRILTSQESAAGLTAVWARENTRRHIFDALNRKEVYATTGTRLRVRLFAGWDFESDDVSRPDFADHGYAGGVPMGGDLIDAPNGKAPTFMIRALRDPDGANLDRIQIIKGWIDAEGATHERIYDVAVSDGRKIADDGRCKTPVGSTVNLEEASYTNTIGDAVMSAFWQDPEFDPKQGAFYYVRVLEIPTPRWTTHDAVFFKIPRPDRVPASTQDRAYTSPVWYTPAK